MKKINYGHFEGDVYIKYIDYNKAVLWMTRQISLPKAVVDRIIENKIKTIRFIDEKKKIQYEVPVETAQKIWEYKVKFQEPQYYFSIEFLKESKYEKQRGEGDL